MSTSSAYPRRIAVAAGYGALAIGLPYGAATYASPESSAWVLMALCVCGLGVAGFRVKVRVPLRSWKGRLRAAFAFSAQAA
jgi:hypothetical protein